METEAPQKIVRQSGVAVLKSEYIVTHHANFPVPEAVEVAEEEEDNKFSADILENEDLESPAAKKLKFSRTERKKIRGQNKARPPPMKFNRGDNLCPQLLDLDVGYNQENEVKNKTGKCQNGDKCPFQHDILKFLANKPPDLGPTCHIYNTYGLCPRGPTCRFASSHLTPEGKNVVNTELWEKTKSQPPVSANILSKNLQITLRKRKYSFAHSEAVLAKEKLDIDVKKEINQGDEVVGNEDAEKVAEGRPGCGLEDFQPLSKVNSEKNGSGEVVADEEPKCGPVSDEDLIHLRKVERRKVEILSRLHFNVHSIVEAVMLCNSGMMKQPYICAHRALWPFIISNYVSVLFQLDWRGKLYLSPLTTVGNLPFRRICKEYGADITCGEMALASSLLQGAQAEWALVRRHCSEDFFGVQLCGNNPYVLTRCAQMLEEQTSIDFIDLNLGCPIDLIYKQGAGSGLLRRENALGTIVRSMAGVLNLPLTLKTRTGVHSDKNVAHTLIPKFIDWGASAITLHGRSREQRYTRLADWDYIHQCAKLASPVPLFGNGDILSFEDYEKHTQDGTVAGVMIGRGALMKPWIFQEIKERRHYDISSGERFEILKKYANYGLEHWGSDNKGVETTRRFMLEWLSFLHRYIPIGLLERPPQRINERPPPYIGRDDLETLMASPDCQNWIKISEMILGPVPENFHFLPKHKANSWK